MMSSQLAVASRLRLARLRRPRPDGGWLPASPRVRRAAVPALLVIVATALSYGYTASAWLTDPTTTWVGNVGDPEQNQWFLGWLPYAIGHGLNPLISQHVLFPDGVNLMWNTSVLLPALLLSPVTVLFGPTVAYNVALLLCPPTAALAAYFAIRRWTSQFAAAGGALLFAFSPFFFRQAQDHLHMAVTAFVPLFFLTMDEVFRRQRRRWWVAGGLLGLVALGQFFTAEEFLATDVLLGAGAVAVLAACYWRVVAAKIRYAGRALAVAAGVFAVVAAYPLWVQFGGPQRVPGTIHAPNVYVNDLANLIVPVGQWLALGSAHGMNQSWTGNPGEWNGYLGIPLLLVILLALVVGWRRPIVRVAGGLFVVVEILSFGPNLHIGGHVTTIWLPWQWVQRLPLFHNALPNRLGVYVYLFAGLLTAVLIDHVIAWVTTAVRAGKSAGVPARRPWEKLRAVAVGAAAGLLIVVVLSWLPAAPAVTTVTEPAYFTSTGEAADLPAGTVAVVLPYVSGPNLEDAEVWQARSGFRMKMPGGWLIVPGPHHGVEGPTYQVFGEVFPDTTTLDDGLAAAVRAEWRQWGVTKVIVGPGPYDQNVIAGQVSYILGGVQPRWTGGVAVFDVPQ